MAVRSEPKCDDEAAVNGNGNAGPPDAPEAAARRRTPWGTAWPDDIQVVFDKDPNTDGVQELKLWQALEAYMATFPDGDGDGVPDLSNVYLGPDGRIVGYE